MKLLFLMFLPGMTFGQQDSMHVVNDMIRYENFNKKIDAQERSEQIYKMITQPEKAREEIQYMIMQVESQLILDADDVEIKDSKLQLIDEDKIEKLVVVIGDDKLEAIHS